MAQDQIIWVERKRGIMEKKLNMVAIFIFIFISYLFFIKYFGSYPKALLNGTLLQLGAIFFLLVGYIISKKYITTDKAFQISYILTTFLFVIFCFVILFLIDKNTTQVDRWSALEYFIRELLHGNFPYAVQTHLNSGNTPSPFPFMYVIAFPFYLLGDVGLLQPFIFLLFSYFIYKIDLFTNQQKFMIILILISTPAYLWEVAVRSDIMSNLLLAVPVVYYAYEKQESTFKNSILSAIIIGLLLNTRTINVIPLLLIFVGIYLKKKWTHSIVSIAIILSITALFFIPFVVWDKDLFMQYSPFFLQSNKAPTWLIVFITLSALGIGLKKITPEKAYYISGVLLFSLIFVTFIIAIFKYSLYSVIYEDRFDISYFNMSIPFLLMSIFNEKKD